VARMRSVKPEFWADPSLARMSRDSRLLYIALWNFADEHGRMFGDPRFVKGHAFPYDDDLSVTRITVLLAELTSAGKVQPYKVAGEAYLFLPKLAKHQRLEAEKVPSRLPGPDESAPEPEPPAVQSVPRTDEPAPRASELSLKHVAGGMGQVAGGREHDSTTSGADAPRTDTAQAIVGEWLDHCRKRPPANVIGQTSKAVKQMLEEGIAADDVRRGMSTWRNKGLHPSALASCVNEAMNASPVATGSIRRSATDKATEWYTMPLPAERKAIGS
jgi:hypothetical protein